MVLAVARTIKAGSSSAATLTLFPLGGFAQTVQLSCGTLPANVTCSFNKPSLALDGTNPASAQVAIGVPQKLSGPQSFSVNMTTTSAGTSPKSITLMVNLSK